jgi:hypothetical protein
VPASSTAAEAARARRHRSGGGHNDVGLGGRARRRSAAALSLSLLLDCRPRNGAGSDPASTAPNPARLLLLPRQSRWRAATVAGRRCGRGTSGCVAPQPILLHRRQQGLPPLLRAPRSTSRRVGTLSLWTSS